MNILRLAIERPVFITMIALFLAALGVLSFRQLPLELYPSVSYPMLGVRTSLPGAAPEEVEQQVTKKVEDALSTLAGIKALRSMTREGVAMVSLEFDIGADIRFQEMQARAKIANIRRSLPDDASEPVVFRFDPDEEAIIEVAITGDLAASELSDLAENVVARRLRQLDGVGDIDISGARSREVRVDVRPDALDLLKINATDVVQALQKFNRNDPIGRLEGSEYSWVARSLSQAVSENELGGIPVARDAKGAPVFLRDIADIRAGYSEVQRVSMVHDENGLHPAVVVGVIKQSGENTVAISDRVRDTLKDLAEDIPPGVTLRISRDNAELVRLNVADVYESLLTAALLTIAVVLLFLQSHRSTLTTGLALPSSILTTFIVLQAAGMTINVMTLLAFSLSIGLLVDDAIVVRENIYRHLRTGSGNGRQAAYQGAREVVLAVIATTLTIVAVFLPVAFMGGLTGQFFKSFALTVVFAMLVSLWDSLTVAPMLSAYYANVPNPAREWNFLGGRWFYRFLALFERAFAVLEHGYSRLLAVLLPRWWIAAIVMVIAMAGAVFGFSRLKTTFLPAQLGSTFRVGLNGPSSIPLASVEKVARDVDRRVKESGLFSWWTISVGGGFGGTAGINLNLRTRPELAKDQDALADIRQKVRRLLAGIPGYSVRISEPADPLSGAGGGRFMPLGVAISGPDNAKLLEISQSVRALMGEVRGVADVMPSQDNGLPEVRFRTDPLLAARYGVTPAIVAENLRLWIEGDGSNALRKGDDQIPVRVQVAGGNRLAPDQILQRNLYVRGSDTLAVPLASFVRVETGAGPAGINRENRQRTVRVGAGLEHGAALGDVVRDLRLKLHELALPAGYAATVVGQSQQMEEATRNILVALALGALFIYMVLASLFESFVQPLTVMVAIPLAATGAVLALLSFGLPLDLYGGIGMVLLAGIVAKNSILLVDFAAQRVRQEHHAPVQAMLEAAPLRLRPILMTSVAMVAGMLPVALGLGATGQARQGLGITTIGGVVSSTLLTLLVVPNLFVAMEKLRRLVRRGK